VINVYQIYIVFVCCVFTEFLNSFDENRQQEMVILCYFLKNYLYYICLALVDF